jgi:hypothetical protein
MQRPAGIYRGLEGRTYLAVYNYQHDVSTLLPPDFRSTERVAAVSYSKGGEKGGVDVFLLHNGLPPVTDMAKIRKTISIRDGGFRIEDIKRGVLEVGGYNPSEVNLTYDIRSQVVADFPEEIRNEALGLTQADIYYFCGEEVAKNPRGPSTEVVPRIIPVTEIRRVVPERVLRGGKAEFVPQCVLEANIDYTKGCLTSWIPGEEPSFDGQFFRDYWHFVWGDCEYCYALTKHKSFPKSIYEFDRQRLLEELGGEAKLIFGSDETFGRPIEILRFGKRTEPWTPWTEDDLLGTLEAMIETRTKGVITTKFMPFDQKFVDLLRRTRSTVMYSTGAAEDVELGPIEWGCDNDFRIEQAARYREVGVNAVLFYLIHPTFPPTENDLENLERAQRGKVPVQFTPARFYTREATQRMIAPLVGLEKRNDILIQDVLRDDSPEQVDLIPHRFEYANSYEMSSGILIPKLDRMHYFWRERIGSNQGKSRMCAHDSETTFCGGCFTKPGTISPTEHQERKQSDLVQVKNRRYEKRKKGDFQDPNQIPIELDN